MNGEKAATLAGVLVFVAAFLTVLAVYAVGIWAVVELVRWVTR